MAEASVRLWGSLLVMRVFLLALTRPERTLGVIRGSMTLANVVAIVTQESELTAFKVDVEIKIPETC